MHDVSLFLFVPSRFVYPPDLFPKTLIVHKLTHLPPLFYPNPTINTPPFPPPSTLLFKSYYKGVPFEHISESSKQQEVANLLADMIFISRCVALEAVHDSGLSKMFLEFFCARWGICPPSRNLLDCQPQWKTEEAKRQRKEKEDEKNVASK